MGLWLHRLIGPRRRWRPRLVGSIHWRWRAPTDHDVVTGLATYAEMQPEFNDAAVVRMPLSVGSGWAQDRRERVDRGFPQVDPVAARVCEDGEIEPHRPWVRRLKVNQLVVQLLFVVRDALHGCRRGCQCRHGEDGRGMGRIAPGRLVSRTSRRGQVRLTSPTWQ